MHLAYLRTEPLLRSLAWAFHAVGGFGLSLVLPTVIFDLGAVALYISINFSSNRLTQASNLPP
jgi:hypothetical protein